MRVLLYTLLLPLVAGFAPANLGSARPSTLLQASSVDGEVSRRAALVVAAALAAGAPPASAASISKAVLSKLEKDNLASVNSNGAAEKHLPKMSVSGSTVEVSVPHVMDPEQPHYIQYLWLKEEASGQILAAKAFQPTDASPPSLSAEVKPGSTVRALLYCNLHGLWEGECLYF